MTLKVREGWQSVTGISCGVTYLYPPREITTSNGWYVDYIDMPDDEKEIAAYPNGGREYRVFSDMNEAHAYLINVGSESPWEEV
jgi:hypothetical protein